MKGGFGEWRNPEDGFSVGTWHGVTRGHLGHFCPVLFLVWSRVKLLNRMALAGSEGRVACPPSLFFFSLLFFPPFFMCFIWHSPSPPALPRGAFTQPHMQPDSVSSLFPNNPKCICHQKTEPNTKWDPRKHVWSHFLPSKRTPNGNLWVHLNSPGKPLCNCTCNCTLCLRSSQTNLNVYLTLTVTVTLNLNLNLTPTLTGNPTLTLTVH